MIITDEKMVTKYKDVEKNLAKLVKSKEDAFLIMWLDIAVVVKASNIQQKKDFYGNLMNDLTGANSHGNEIYDALENESDFYLDTMKKFRYGKTANELGSYWRKLICDEKPFRLRLLASYLNVYQKVFLPYLKWKMREWIKSEEEGNDSSIILEESRGEWKYFKAGIKYTKNIAEVACDIFQLQCSSNNQ